MKNYKGILIYIAFFCFVGCKPTIKSVEKVETLKSDTLIIKSKTTETPPVLTTLNIVEICDTITGKAKEFKYRYVYEKDTLEVSLLNNELSMSNNQLAQIKSKFDSIANIKKETINSSKEVEKFKVPWYHWLIHVLLTVIVLLLTYLYIKK